MLNRRVRYHPQFAEDVLGAAEWYEARSTGLGSAFTALVRQATESIITDPERFAPLEHVCRYVQLPRFPYLVLFAVDDSELLIVGVIHAARSPEVWQRRLDP